MNTLVIGGTGTVGGHVISDLLRAGSSVRCLTRSKDKLRNFPVRVDGVIGDLEDPKSLPKAFEGMDSMFLLVGLAQNETELGLNAVNAAKDAGLRKIVYMSVHMPEGCERIPHFRSKIPIEEAVRNSGISYAILRPNNFFQNDYWFKDSILTMGVYPQPLGSVGVSRIDVRDISEAALHAFQSGVYDGRIWTLVGPDALTGEAVAKLWGRYLGREIRYAGDDLDAFAERAKTMLPEWMVHDFRIMYQYFQEEGLKATDDDLLQTRTILGREPRRFEAFVEEISKSWRDLLKGRYAEAV
ncbi:MAG: NmrA family NAD(P)-binding protein [Candidatus Sumerlaeota bacterium]|nr:NmrA family NAD(P)-binding protein [Candidatus Sumerlaeota bacterium]